MRQLGFSFQNDYKKEFGGSLLQGKRKSARPLSTKKPIQRFYLGESSFRQWLSM